MKIKGSITAVEDVGASLKVTIQGAPVVDALKEMQAITFRVPCFTRNCSAFYVGRQITMEITLE